MAKKSKKKKSSRAAPKQVEPKAPSMFWRGAGAVFLIILAIFLVFGAVTSAPLPKGAWDGAWWVFGAGAILVPPALLYFGLIKFMTEEHKVPFGKFLSIIGGLVVFSSITEALFATTNQQVQDDATGGYGGIVGMLLGGALVSLLGKVLAVALLGIAFIVLVFLTFNISFRDMLGKFKRENSEDDGEEDLAKLKKRAGFAVNEGVPVEHHEPVVDKPAPKMGSLKNTAQKLTGTEDHAALTIASDPNWQFPPLNLLNQKQDKHHFSVRVAISKHYLRGLLGQVWADIP